MPTLALDHVNILTRDLDATVAFYGAALELRVGDSPLARMGRNGAWLYDCADKPIVHVLVVDEGDAFDAHHRIGEPTAAIHHVAFRCQGSEAAIGRLRGIGIEPRISDAIPGVRQLFVVDPNGINVEMNFTDD